MMTLIPVFGFGPAWWTPSVPLVSKEDILGSMVSSSVRTSGVYGQRSFTIRTRK
jgi:hypothetical protein